MRFWYLFGFSLKRSTAEAFAEPFKGIEPKEYMTGDSVRFRIGTSWGWKKKFQAKTGFWYPLGVLFRISDEFPRRSQFSCEFFIPWGSRAVVACWVSEQSDVCPTVEPLQYTGSPLLEDYQADSLRTGILQSKASSQMSYSPSFLLLGLSRFSKSEERIAEVRVNRHV